MLYLSNPADFLRFISKNLVGTRGKNYRLTAKRLGVFLLALLIYIPIEILIWIGLILDEVFFPAYKRIKIEAPIFIIGNPRSGTTFLQRLLAKDSKNFVSMKTWEIFVSPSIISRKAIRLIVKTARAIGIPIMRRVRRLENIWKDTDIIHRLRLRAVEEDEYLFIHNFSTMKIWSFAALEDEAEPYIFYDQLIPTSDKIRNMDFYTRCIQRHYFSQGQPEKIYLSKNPNFSPAIKTLLSRFPNARFIYLIRNPIDAVPSHISLKEREWRMLGSPLRRYASADFIMKSSLHWYNYPISVINDLPADQGIIVRFDDLVGDAESAVREIYQRFDLEISSDFESILASESAKAKRYQSQHHYDLNEMGLSRDELGSKFQDVIEDYQFPL